MGPASYYSRHQYHLTGSGTRSGALQHRDRHGEPIADAALGLDDARGARIRLQLAPQPQDLHIDASVENILMHTRRLQQMLAGERAIRRVEERGQQRVLALRQKSWEHPEGP